MPAARFYLVLFLGTTLVLVNSCGGNLNCGGNSLKVLPAAATADHGALPPANGQAFSAFSNVCAPAATAASVNSNWTASDSSVHLSASPNMTVIATCTATLANPVTITATEAGGTATGKASLTCN